MSSPSTMIWPESGFKKTDDVSQSDCLADAVGPRMANVSPRSTKRRRRQNLAVAEGLVDTMNSMK
jgi:hypothetical protein